MSEPIINVPERGSDPICYLRFNETLLEKTKGFNFCYRLNFDPGTTFPPAESPTHLIIEDMLTDDEEVTPVGKRTWFSNDTGLFHFMFTEDFDGGGIVEVWSPSEELLEKSKKWLLANAVRAQKSEDQIDMAVWSIGEGRGRINRRKIKTTLLADNYSPGITNKIQHLIKSGKKLCRKGKIIIWGGPPGTGKTHAILSFAGELVRAHPKEIDVEYISDPDRFFDSANYLLSVVGSNTSSENKLRLIIIEDSAELFSSGCRNTAGFSKLLNVTDGILGQGQDIIFLLSFNEKIDFIDPAVLRPGRCIQKLEFTLFTRDQAITWLEHKNVDTQDLPDRDSFSLAEMYEIYRNSQDEIPAPAADPVESLTVKRVGF